MSYLCVSPYKLSLPAALRNLSRAEFSSSHRFHSSLYERRPILSSPPCHQFNTYRYFSSSLRTLSSQSENPAPSSGSPEAKKRWKTHKHTKDRRPENDNTRPKKKEDWQIQKDALNEKFKEGWNPPKKLSPDAVDGIRQLHAVAPDQFTTPVLAEQFKVTPEAIRRILKSKWRPTEAEAEDRRRRWRNRNNRIWSQMTELGLRKPRRRAQRFSDANSLYDDDDKPRPR